MVPSSVVQGRKVGGQGVFGCPPSLIRGILPLLRATQSPPGGDQRPPCKWCCPHPQPPTQETRPLRAGVRPLDPSEPAQPSLAISPECSPAGHSVKGTLSPRVYEPRSPCPAGGASTSGSPPSWPHPLSSCRAPRGPGAQPGHRPAARDPVCGRAVGRCTYRCSVGSTARGWSLPLGIPWSITIVSVFARQNPLDRMISENESGAGRSRKGSALDPDALTLPPPTAPSAHTSQLRG